MDAFNVLTSGVQQASQNLVDNFTERVNKMGSDLMNFYSNAPDMIPSDASASEDSEESDERPKDQKLLIDEIYEALDHVHSALASVEPNKSKEELEEIYTSLDKNTKHIVDMLLFRISKETDSLIVREAILQAKVKLYEDWSKVISEHSHISFPEASKATESLSRVHTILFEKYPGRGTFTSLNLSPTSLLPETELDPKGRVTINAATFMHEASLQPSKPVLKEMAMGSALKQQKEDLAFFLRLKKFFQKFIPICNWLPNYNIKNLQGDFIAGVTSGVFVIPQAMAYSLLIGIPPKYGLYSAFVPAIIYAFFGGCGQVAYGPVAMLSLLLNTALQDYSDATIADKVAICVLLAFMKGFTQLLMGILKFGFITTFLSQPVLSGFTSAAAIIIIISQLKLIFGVSCASSSYPIVTLVNTLSALFGAPFRWGTFLLGLGTIFFLLFAKHCIVVIPKTKIPFPGPILAVVFGIVLMVAAPDLQNSIDTVGNIPDGLPQPSFPITLYTYARFGSLTLNYLVMALLSFLEMITVGKLYSSKNGYTVEPNGELVAGGLANVVGSFFTCFPVTGGFGRSPVNANAGAKTQLTGLFSSIIVAIVLLWLTRVFSYLPKTILAAIIFVAVLAIIDTDQAKYLWMVNKTECGLMLVTFLITLGIGPQYGIFLSIGLSLLLVLWKSSRPGFAILGRLPGTAIYRSIIDFPEAICIPGIVLFQYHSPIYFMNATYFKRKLTYTEALLSRHTRTEAIIIDAQAITSVDSVGLSMIKEIVETFSARKVVVCFAATPVRTDQALERAGLKALIGEKNFFPRLHDAIRSALNNELQFDVHELPSLVSPSPPPSEPKKPKTSFFGKMKKDSAWEEQIDIDDDTHSPSSPPSPSPHTHKEGSTSTSSSSEVDPTAATARGLGAVGGLGAMGGGGPSMKEDDDSSDSSDSSSEPITKLEV